MYYGMILLSVFMFGGCFALKDVYRQMRGSGFLISMESATIGAFAGLAVLVVINGFQLELTPFTFLMALLCAANGVGFSYFSFKALDYINLSVFSLFSMLGGMLLPSAVGILFFGESITVAKIVCYILILAALLLTLSKGKKGGWIWYAGVFVLNGMSGVLSKIFASAPFEKTSAAGYSIWSALITGCLAGIIWLSLLARKTHSNAKPYSFKAFGISSLSGATNKIANFLLVLALANVDASVQYPMVTGGVMIVSTLICFFGARRPSKKEILSVGIAFVGMLALFVIPV